MEVHIATEIDDPGGISNSRGKDEHLTIPWEAELESYVWILGILRRVVGP